MLDDFIMWLLMFYAASKHDAETAIISAIHNVDTYFDSRIEKGVLYVLKVDSSTVENGKLNIITQEGNNGN